MIVPDINHLLYAYNDGAPRYEPARIWWEELLNGDEAIGLPWVVSHRLCSIDGSLRIRDLAVETR